MAASTRAAHRPSFDIVDVIAPCAAVQPTPGSATRPAQALQRRVGQPEMKGGLLRSKEGTGFACELRPQCGVVHAVNPMNFQRLLRRVGGAVWTAWGMSDTVGNQWGELRPAVGVPSSLIAVALVVPGDEKPRHWRPGQAPRWLRTSLIGPDAETLRRRQAGCFPYNFCVWWGWCAKNSAGLG